VYNNWSKTTHNAFKSTHKSRTSFKLHRRSKFKFHPLVMSSSSKKRKISEAAATKYYAVRAGHTPGVYTSWTDCQQNTTGFKGAQCKSPHSSYQVSMKSLLTIQFQTNPSSPNEKLETSSPAKPNPRPRSPQEISSTQ
jgi:hypothetical protein